jgi:hypothetical protein
MNKWNQLLVLLDRVFGFEEKKSSTYRKVSQFYDERTGEHVVLLEYRVRVEPGVSMDKRKQNYAMIQQLRQRSAVK